MELIKKEEKKRLRICMCSEHSCIRVLKQALILKKQGHIVDLATHLLPQGRPYYNAVSMYTGQRELAMAVDASHADIYHVHNEPDWLVPTIAPLLQNRYCPIIWDMHDPDHLRGKESIDGYELASYNLADAVIHVSEAAKASADKELGDYKPSIVIYSYVNEQFTAKDEDIVPDPSFNSVVYEGGMDAISKPQQVEGREGVDVNLRYMPDIVKAFREQGYAFNILAASNMPNLLYESIGAYVAKPVVYPSMLAGLRPHGLGFVGAAYQSDLMQVAMPNKLFEYISQGVVPIVFNANEVAKFVKDNDCGIVLDSLKNLKEQLKNASKKRKNVLRLRKEIMMESQTDKLLDLYYSLLTKKKEEFETHKKRDRIIKAEEVQPIEKAKPEPEPEKSTQFQISGDNYVTEKDVTEFGQETIDLATRIASGIVKDTLANYDTNLRGSINDKFIEQDQKFAPIVQDINAVKNTQFLTAQQRFDSDMRSMVQDYDLHKGSLDFQTFLDQSDSKHSKWTNRIFLKDAEDDGDVEGAAQIFSEYFQTISIPGTSNLDLEASGEQINETVAVNKLESDAKPIQQPMFYSENGALIYEDGTPVKISATDNIVKVSNIPLNQISPPASMAGDESEGFVNPEKPKVYMKDLTDMTLQLSKNPGSVSDAAFQKKLAEVNLARVEGRLIMS